MAKVILRIMIVGFLLSAVSQATLAQEEAMPELQKPEAELTSEDIQLEEMYEDLETFANALTIIEVHYVDASEPRDLIYGALKGMLASLDPYSQFLDPEAHREMKVDTVGKFGGIGVEISIQDGVLTIISPIDDTPADKAGIMPGDKIVKIDDKSTRHMSLGDAVKVLRGKIGSDVNLSIYREEAGKVLEFTLTRDTISVKSIKLAAMLEEGIGYVRISEFQEATPRDFKDTIETLEAEGMTGLILDLRNNPGGLFPEAIRTAEVLVPRDEVIVSIKGRSKGQTAEFTSKGPKEPKPYPIVVLVNRGSASAAEILAGAIQDHRLGLLLGTKTFGKGSVQTVIPMRDGSAVRLTTSKYYTPSGRLIHGEGLEPDVEVPFEPRKLEDLTEKEKKEKKVHDLFDKVSEKFGLKDEDKERLERLRKQDNQVQRARDLIRALNVYGNFEKTEELVIS